MQTASNQLDKNIQIRTNIQLPKVFQARLRERASNILEKYTGMFAYKLLCLNLKETYDRIGCEVVLVTDQGLFQTYVESGSVETGLNSLLDVIDTHLHRQLNALGSSEAVA